MEYGNPPYRRTLTNHNKMLSYYEGATGVKTGFTTNAGRCLVSSAEREGVSLICVNLSCPDDWNVHEYLLDACFEAYRNVPLEQLTGTLNIPLAGGEKTKLPVKPL